MFLDKIQFELDAEELAKRLRIKPGSSDAKDFKRMCAEASGIARPKAIYREAHVEERMPDEVIIDSHWFNSRVLRVNLDTANQVYVFVATCGIELQAWGESIQDWLWNYWAETIKEEALFCALRNLQEHLRVVHRLGHTSTMSPGSLENWPISEQAVLFSLLGSLVEKSGVILTDSMLMIPSKSVSGIVFETDASFESCMLCPRAECLGRRAPYDETLYEREYCPSVC